MRVSFFCTTFAQNFKPNTKRSMKNNRVPIGKLVSDELARQGRSVRWLADNACTSLQNCYKMLHADSLNTDVLRTLSIVLNHNFFADYAALLELPQTPPPTLRPGTLHEEFYALIEPYLKEAGYKGQILKSGKLVIWKGNVRITIYHGPMVYDNRYERVCLMYRFNDKLLRELPQPGGLVLTNTLSFHNPELHFIYTTNGPILVSYMCTILEPQDIIAQLYYATDLYMRARNQFYNDLSKIHDIYILTMNESPQD